MRCRAKGYAICSWFKRLRERFEARFLGGKFVRTIGSVVGEGRATGSDFRPTGEIRVHRLGTSGSDGGRVVLEIVEWSYSAKKPACFASRSLPQRRAS
jgi:hypothetical protein